MAWTLAASMSAAALVRSSAMLGLGLGLQVALQRVGRLAGLLDDAGRLVLGVGQLRLVLGEDARRPRCAGRLGRVEVAADPLGAGVHALLDGRAGRTSRAKNEDDDEAEAPQMISFVAGRSGFGAFWQSSTVSPLVEASRCTPRRPRCASASRSVLARPPVLASCADAARRTRATSRTASSRCERAVGSRMVASSAPARKNDHEADQGEGLDEGDAEEHGGAHHAGGLGLAGHGLDGLADQVADADAGADGAEAVRRARCPCCRRP